MRNSPYSSAQSALANGAVYVMYATMQLNDRNTTDNSNTILCLTPTEFTVSSNNNYSSGSTNKGFPIGCVISDALTMELNNHTYMVGGDEQPRPFTTYGGLRKYFITNNMASESDAYITKHVNTAPSDSDIVDYYGAQFFVRLQLKQNGSTVANATISLGRFTVYKDANYGNVVVLNTMDDLIKADREFRVPSSMATGEKLLSLWFGEACEQSGLSVAQSTLTTIANTAKKWAYDLEKPITCRELLGYIAMLVGGNVKYRYISGAYYVTLLQYDMTSSTASKSFEMDEWFKLDTSLVDVQITGVKTTSDKVDYHYPDATGYDTYALTITNPLIKSVKNEMEGTEIAEDTTNILKNLEDIYNVVGGHPFRIFSGEIRNFPFAEFMDVIRFTDAYGESYISFLTNVNYVVGGVTQISNTSPTPTRIAQSFSSVATTISQLESSIVQERTAREEMADAFNVAIRDSAGLYFDKVKDEQTGAETWFFHDKENLEESEIVTKIDINGIGMSNDGGQTYLYGFTSNANLIMDIISANYINADWIKAGKLSIVDPQNPENVIFEVDTGNVISEGAVVSSGTAPYVYMNASSVTITTTNETTDLNAFAQNIEDNGVTKVQTAKGFKFDDNGLTITSTENNVQNVLDETGMKVLGMDNSGNYTKELLKVTYDGTAMDNLTVKNELAFGKWQFESMGGNKMGCFFRG